MLVTLKQQIRRSYFSIQMRLFWLEINGKVVVLSLATIRFSTSKIVRTSAEVENVH